MNGHIDMEAYKRDLEVRHSSTIGGNPLAGHIFVPYEILRLNRIRPIKSILDVGCHDGRFMRYLNEHIKIDRRVGLNLVQECLDYASDEFDSVVNGDAHSLPFGDGEFDVVLALAVIRSSYAPTILVDELFRVANLGVIIAEPLAPDNSSEPHLVTKERVEDWVNFLARPKWSLLNATRPDFKVCLLNFVPNHIQYRKEHE